MGYQLKQDTMNQLLQSFAKDYLIYAPKLFEGGGIYSDTDCIRYGEVTSVEEIVFDKKSNYSFKEVLTPISQTLFYFTQGETKVSDAPKKGAIVFLRSCDLHAVKRLDDMYLSNGPEDIYYKELRSKIKFVLMGCSTCFDHCFCVDMGTNISTNYDLAINVTEQGFDLDCKWEEAKEQLETLCEGKAEVTPDYVNETKTHVQIPEHLTSEVAKSEMWREYDGRCVNCGRCNFVCPTCTCFTMQDLYYDANGEVGERRRVWASCMVDGYTDVAGGGSYRKANGDRMRFKVLHKVLDYKERNGYHMCVGCGRCDDVCPEYISFSNCINKLEDAMKEVESNE